METTMQTLGDAEITALSVSASHGDVMRICFWMGQAAFERREVILARIVREVGPRCVRDALHRACELMPRAPEPRLLRAAAILADMRAGRPACPDLAWRDLVEVSCVWPHEPTATALLSELARFRRAAA
ncbi:MAG TPA: hypothetical protein VIF62_26165 [Labilithrix sp.]|jgi:hypothetical protein